MIVLPYGHDQSVYGRQWVTYGLIALNVAAFAVTWVVEERASARLEARIEALADARLEHPDARIDPSVLAGAPDGAVEIFAGIVQRDEDAPLTDEDIALEGATRDALSALGELPSQRFGYRPGDPSPLTFVTSLFLHGGLWHLLGNMLFLWLAGAVIECFWDSLPFLGLYFLAGAGATLAHHLSAPDSMTPVIGASGAISGLLGAFVVGYPRTRVRLLWAVWPIGIGHTHVPAWALILVWAGLQIAWALIDPGDGVARWAHLGGFAVGVIGALVMKRMGWVIEDAGDGTSIRYPRAR